MAKVKILTQGYVRNNEESVAVTTTLIQSGKINIVVDPGMGKNRARVLKRALKKEGLRFEDIDIVFCTHYHLDHTQYISLFSKAKLIDGFYTYKNDSFLDHAGEGQKLGPGVSIIHTPGHGIEDASLVVQTEKGTVVVAGDVWWYKGFTRKDPYAWNQKQLEKSRKKVLKLANWIVPGHGKMFKNPLKT